MKIFSQAFVENYFCIFKECGFFTNGENQKTIPVLILIGYPQFVPILFYTIFAASFQI